MQVAPMPERPPFTNGLTAFQVELSAKDMVWRMVGFVRLRGAGVTRDRRRRCVIATPEARSAGRLQPAQRIRAVVAHGERTGANRIN